MAARIAPGATGLPQAFGGSALSAESVGHAISQRHARDSVRALQADEAVPDFEYGYGDALGDGGVVRPIYFPAVGGVMEWSAPDGMLQAASFDDPLRQALCQPTSCARRCRWKASGYRPC